MWYETAKKRTIDWEIGFSALFKVFLFGQFYSNIIFVLKNIVLYNVKNIK